MEAPSYVVVLTSLLLLLTSAQTSSAQLTRGFYSNICPNVEQLVRSAVTQKLQQTFVTAPSTLRLFFHDCFVRVCKPTSWLHIIWCLFWMVLNYGSQLQLWLQYCGFDGVWNSIATKIVAASTAFFRNCSNRNRSHIHGYTHNLELMCE